MAKIKTLRAHPLFAALADRDIALFSRIVHEGELPAGTTLFIEGKESTTFILVQKGKIGVAGTALPGEGAALGEGEVLGQWSLLAPPHPSAVTARTLEPVSLLVVKRGDFEVFLREAPEAAARVQRALLAGAWEDLVWLREQALPAPRGG